MNYLDDRIVDLDDIKSGWILVAIANLGLVVLAL